MSGLFGCSSNSQIDSLRVIVEQMGEQMRHQPYSMVETASPAPTVGLGRLGIGIFNRTPQPAVSPDKRVQVWLCGEFYHQAERRAEMVRRGELNADADDVKLALSVYLIAGAKGLTELDGAFLIAVWDERAGELVLVNDRYGLYPHYFAHHTGEFVFAPEIKGVLCAPSVRRHLNLVAIAEYLRFQQLLGEKTWFEGIELLPAASLIRYRVADDQLSLARY